MLLNLQIWGIIWLSHFMGFQLNLSVIKEHTWYNFNSLKSIETCFMALHMVFLVNSQSEKNVYSTFIGFNVL